MKHSLLETTIGAVVLVAALIFLVFSYSTAHQGEEGVMAGSYKLTALFENVGGLKTGDDVMIGGVKIGSISSITLDQKLYRAAVTFTVADHIKLAKDTAARISSQSLLGGKYMDLQPGGDDVDLSNGDVIAQTQSATNLEDLLGRYIFSANGKQAAAAPASSAAPAADDPMAAEPEHP